MFEKIKDMIRASRPLQFALVFIAGGTVAAVFYPTKQIQEKLQKTYEQQISTLTQQHAQELANTKTQYDSQTQTLTNANAQLSSKIAALTTQISSMKSHQKQTYYKIIHPDGTVEIRASSERDTSEEEQLSQQIQQEYQQQLQTQISQLQQTQTDKITSMQKEWDSKEQSYQQHISTLTQSKTVTTNPKNFTVDVGALSNLDYYGHATYNIWGPFILGLQGQMGSSPAIGGGIGLRF
jgi:ATP-dependent Lon protease